MHVKKWVLALIVCSFLALGSIAGVSAYLVGNSQGYQAGHTNGYRSGYAKGHADGYDKGSSDGYSTGQAQGYTEGYTQGYNAEQSNFQQWVNQSCFTYPFLLIDSNSYMACHR